MNPHNRTEQSSARVLISPGKFVLLDKCPARTLSHLKSAIGSSDCTGVTYLRQYIWSLALG
jgi:hypothetical protein